MKISLVGLSGCGKTSLYSVTFAMKSAQETKKLAPTIMYEIRRHPFLGLEVSLFDFGGQEQYRKEYEEKPEMFSTSDIIIPVIDLHDPDNFDKAKEYFAKIIEICQKAYQKPRIHLFFHKYDTEDGFQRELLDNSVKKAKEMFLEQFKEYDPQWSLTSIYEQEKLAKIFRDILVSSYETLRGHIEKAENQLKEINAKIIVADISGNVIVHNVSGITSGLQLRGDFRDFIESCNTMRENFFMSDSARFTGTSEEGKELELHLLKYILAVLVLKSDDFDSDSMEKLRVLLQDMTLFADLVVSAHEDSL